MITNIANEADYQEALAEIDRLWEKATVGSAEEVQLDRLAKLAHNYERSLEPLPRLSLGERLRCFMRRLIGRS